MINEAIQGVIGTGTLAIIGWVIQLGNRITVLETREPTIERLIDLKFEGVYQRLDRIERAMNGALRGHNA